jgi:hypothetical protein
METTEKIVESYCRYVKQLFTIPNIKCEGQYEIDLLADDTTSTSTVAGKALSVRFSPRLKTSSTKARRSSKFPKCANVVVFDPSTASDPATYEMPQQYAKGVPFVFVNGMAVIDNGNHTGRDREGSSTVREKTVGGKIREREKRPGVFNLILHNRLAHPTVR